MEDVLELAVTFWELLAIHKHRLAGGSFLQRGNHLLRKIIPEPVYRTFPGLPEKETGSWPRIPTRVVNPSKTSISLRGEQRLNVHFHKFLIRKHAPLPIKSFMSPDVLAVLEPRQRLREKCASAEAGQESVMCCGQIPSQIPSGNPGEILHAQAKIWWLAVSRNSNRAFGNR